MRTAPLLLCVLLLPLQAAAQDSQTPASPPVDVGDLPVPAWGKGSSIRFPSRFIRSLAASRPDGGVGAGVGYNSPEDNGWFQDARAMATLRRFWSLEGEVGRRSLSKRSQIGAFGAVRHMGRLDYFGIGPDTDLDNRAAFRLRETTFGTRGWFRPVPAVRLGGSISAYMPDLGRSNSSIDPLDRSGLRGRVGARLRGRTDIRQISWLCRVSASGARQPGFARRI